MYLASRLDRLRKTQNPDGGWAFYAGKASWLEPTVYAALALHGQPEADQAWQLIGSWQLASGGWRPTAEVPGANWTSALAVLLASTRASTRTAVDKGVEWLQNDSKDGVWSWRRGNPGAVEPTALAIAALRNAGGNAAQWSQSVVTFLLTEPLSPETCGPVLLGLQGLSEVGGIVPMATRWAQETASPLTRAWIEIGLRVNGLGTDLPERGEAALPRNLAVVALEALAARDGNHHLLRTEAAA